MASVKIFSLAVKTLAKPIANTIKAQAAQFVHTIPLPYTSRTEHLLMSPNRHETFRQLCIGLAQHMHRAEARMRMGLLNEEAKNIKPLNDTRAVQNGTTTLAETFLFVVGAALVLGETYRSSRKEGKRRDDVADRLEKLESDIGSIRSMLEGGGAWDRSLSQVKEQNENLQNILETVVANGLKAGWLSLGHDDGIGPLLPLVRQREYTGSSIRVDDSSSSPSSAPPVHTSPTSTIHA